MKIRMDIDQITVNRNMIMNKKRYIAPTIERIELLPEPMLQDTSAALYPSDGTAETTVGESDEILSRMLFDE